MLVGLFQKHFPVALIAHMLSIVNVASRVAGLQLQCFSNALLYKVVSSLSAIANAGSIGIKNNTKSGLSIWYKS
jgi:hypothetical protein